MHSYGRDYRYSPYIHVGLAALAYGLYLLILQGFGSGIAVHIGPIGTLSIFGLLEFLFSRWGWRLLCLIPGVHIYTFGGTYQGNITAGDGTSFPVTLTIKQNWSQISVDFLSGNATSRSFSASVVKDRLAKGNVELIYNYFAPGTHEGEERVGAHHGTTMLKRSSKGRKLSGEYYTERKRDSFGRIELRRVLRAPIDTDDE